jgi:GMP synthase-like glutamine amidotransferase
MSWEKPGSFLVQAARSRRVRLDILEVWHEPVPDLTPYDGLIVLGGTPNVGQEDVYPFLRAEKEAIKWTLDKDKPYLGFCLGHQLLADVLGAKVGPNFCSSVGFVHGQITKEGREHPLFHNIPQSIPLFKWHSQAVLPPLPKEIEILATSRDCQVEAISVHGRPHLVGLQFDNYAASLADARSWVEADHTWLSEKGVDTAHLLKTAGELEYLIGTHFEVIFENYMKLIS